VLAVSPAGQLTTKAACQKLIAELSFSPPPLCPRFATHFSLALFRVSPNYQILANSFQPHDFRVSRSNDSRTVLYLDSNPFSCYHSPCSRCRFSLRQPPGHQTALRLGPPSFFSSQGLPHVRRANLATLRPLRRSRMLSQRAKREHTASFLSTTYKRLVLQLLLFHTLTNAPGGVAPISKFSPAEALRAGRFYFASFPGFGRANFAVRTIPAPSFTTII
jgi:hypothetical protein